MIEAKGSLKQKKTNSINNMCWAIKGNKLFPEKGKVLFLICVYFGNSFQ
jgi:hypothetical protein